MIPLSISFSSYWMDYSILFFWSVIESKIQVPAQDTGRASLSIRFSLFLCGTVGLQIFTTDGTRSKIRCHRGPRTWFRYLEYVSRSLNRKAVVFVCHLDQVTGAWINYSQQYNEGLTTFGYRVVVYSCQAVLVLFCFVLFCWFRWTTMSRHNLE